MALLARLLVLLPAALSVVGLILSALALFAGHQQGFMEEYAIARNLIDTSSDDANSEDEGDGGLLDTIGDAWDDVSDTVVDSVNDLLNEVAGDVANSLGISDWYSIHVMESCEGNYSPNATADDSSLNITDCTNSNPGFRLNLADLLSKELSLGPVDISLEDLGWDDEIQDKVDILNDALLALFIFYVLGMSFSGLTFFASAAAFFLPERRAVSLANLILSTLAALSLIIASIIVTVAVTRGVQEVNDLAGDFGVTVYRGDGFLGLTWGAAGVMLVALVFWAAHFHFTRRARKQVIRSKEQY